MKYKLLVVIHESLYPYEDIAYTFQSSVYRGRYHSFIKRDGSIIYITKANKKAEAAYKSSFNGEEINGSVDPFSYHICLESPPNSLSISITHTGYTDEQYYSLGWLISKVKGNKDRIVLHKDIDTTGKIKDPRNLDIERVKRSINTFNHTSYIETGL